MKEDMFPMPGSNPREKEIDELASSVTSRGKEEASNGEGYQIGFSDGSTKRVKNKKEEMEARKEYNENRG